MSGNECWLCWGRSNNLIRGHLFKKIVAFHLKEVGIKQKWMQQLIKKEKGLLI